MVRIGSKFHHVARAVIIEHGMLLVAQMKGAANTFLPGGHVTIGESAAVTVQRELQEELGVACDVETFLGIVESGWISNGTHHFEVNQIFQVSGPRLTPDHELEARESHLQFFWVTGNELQENNLLPRPLQLLIPNLMNGDHSIWWESTLPTSPPS